MTICSAVYGALFECHVKSENTSAMKEYMEYLFRTFGQIGGNMSRVQVLDYKGRDVTCMKWYDALASPCATCNREDCDEREEELQKSNIKKF